jgi:hypothetical protein
MERRIRNPNGGEADGGNGEHQKQRKAGRHAAKTLQSELARLPHVWNIGKCVASFHVEVNSVLSDD